MGELIETRPPDFVDASPTKSFFLDMFTRDITLEDAILDLIDNAIDALCRKRNIDLSVYYSNGNGVPRIASQEYPGRGKIDVQFSETQFSIEDDCGGIPYEYAKKEMFHFGRMLQSTTMGLSVYGVGLKRAIFKLGKKIKIESKTAEDGWVVDIDVNEWSQQKDNWSFPISRSEPATNENDTGTSITVWELNPEVVMRINDGTLGSTLKQAIATTYPLFLEKHVDISLNKTTVNPLSMSIAGSDDIKPSYLEFNEGNVVVIITAGLAERVQGEWNQDRAGWYILCNGRVVVWADKTDLTGWGTIGPQFHTKFRGFIGLVFFFSNAPESLPWTTTKRGLNRESKVYQLATKKMVLAGRPVIGFLDKISQGYSEQIFQERVVDNLKPLALTEVFGKEETTFKVAPRIVNKVSTARVQFTATMEEIEKVRKCLKQPGMGYGAIGRHALSYFIEQECP
jgi:hypothetical protein